jgi:ADP-glucose pyrophosphorylase
MEFTSGRRQRNLMEHRVRTNGEKQLFTQISTGTRIHNSILSPGNVIESNSNISNSVLGRRVAVEKECNLEHCILLGGNSNGCGNGKKTEKPTNHIGRNSNLSHVILDNRVWIGDDVNIGPDNGNPDQRAEILQAVGLKPYRVLDDGTIDGDFYIDPETGILVIGEMGNNGHEELILPDGTKC